MSNLKIVNPRSGQFESAIATLRDAMAEAEAGNIASVVITVHTPAGHMLSYQSEIADRYAMAGKMLAVVNDLVAVRT